MVHLFTVKIFKISGTVTALLDFSVAQPNFHFYDLLTPTVNVSPTSLSICQHIVTFHSTDSFKTKIMYFQLRNWSKPQLFDYSFRLPNDRTNWCLVSQLFLNPNTGTKL